MLEVVIAVIFLLLGVILGSVSGIFLGAVLTLGFLEKVGVVEQVGDPDRAGETKVVYRNLKRKPASSAADLEIHGTIPDSENAEDLAARVRDYIQAGSSDHEPINRR